MPLDSFQVAERVTCWHLRAEKQERQRRKSGEFLSLEICSVPAVFGQVQVLQEFRAFL